PPLHRGLVRAEALAVCRVSPRPAMAFADRLVGRSRVPAQALSTGQPTTSEIAGSADWAGERSAGLGEPLATSAELCEVRAGRGVLCIVRKTKLPLTRPTLVALGSATLSRKETFAQWGWRGVERGFLRAGPA